MNNNFEIKQSIKKKQKLIESLDDCSWRNVVTLDVEYPKKLLNEGWMITNFTGAIGMAGAGTQYGKEFKNKTIKMILLEKYE